MHRYFFCLLTFTIPLAAQASAAGEDDPIIARSVVTAGDISRLQRALAKGRRGAPVTVAVIGGSITAGAAASSREKNYGSLMAQWWRETLPNAKIELVNAGILAERNPQSPGHEYRILGLGVAGRDSPRP